MGWQPVNEMHCVFSFLTFMNSFHSLPKRRPKNLFKVNSQHYLFSPPTKQCIDHFKSVQLLTHEFILFLATPPPIPIPFSSPPDSHPHGGAESVGIILHGGASSRCRMHTQPPPKLNANSLLKRGGMQWYQHRGRGDSEHRGGA